MRPFSSILAERISLCRIKVRSLGLIRELKHSNSNVRYKHALNFKGWLFFWDTLYLGISGRHVRISAGGCNVEGRKNKSDNYHFVYC